MEKMDFTQAVARLRVLEGRLLNKVRIERMIDCSSAEEALKILQETEYGSLMGSVRRPEDFDFILKDELKRVFSLMYSITPHKSIVDIMSLKYDYHNLKVLIKGKALNKDLNDILVEVGTISIDRLKLIFTTEKFKELPKVMMEATVETIKKFEEKRDPQVIDIMLDKYLFKDMLLRAEETKIDYLSDYVKKNIDFINIKSFVRVKEMAKDVKFFSEVFMTGGNIEENVFVKNFNDTIEVFANKIPNVSYKDVIKKGLADYGTLGKLSSFEKDSEDFLMKEARASKYIHFGPEPLIAYLIAKETEIKVIRIVMVGKINGISPDAIRERLRDVYV